MPGPDDIEDPKENPRGSAPDGGLNDGAAAMAILVVAIALIVVVIVLV